LKVVLFRCWWVTFGYLDLSSKFQMVSMKE
jgi:coenzyme F420-reducing hydrogenase delta subunit